MDTTPENTGKPTAPIIHPFVTEQVMEAFQKELHRQGVDLAGFLERVRLTADPFGATTVEAVTDVANEHWPAEALLSALSAATPYLVAGVLSSGDPNDYYGVAVDAMSNLDRRALLDLAVHAIMMSNHVDEADADTALDAVFGPDETYASVVPVPEGWYLGAPATYPAMLPGERAYMVAIDAIGMVHMVIQAEGSTTEHRCHRDYVRLGTGESLQPAQYRGERAVITQRQQREGGAMSPYLWLRLATGEHIGPLLPPDKELVLYTEQDQQTLPVVQA